MSINIVYCKGCQKTVEECKCVNPIIANTEIDDETIIQSELVRLAFVEKMKREGKVLPSDIVRTK